MAKTIGSLKELYDAAIDAASARIVLMEYVAPVVEEILRKHIEQDVYNAYDPKKYRRSYSLTANVRSQMISDNELFVTSTAVPNAPCDGWHSSEDGAFLYLIETGKLGWWKEGFPRPAISNAQREVDSSSAVRAAKRNGIKQVTRK